MPLWHVYCTTVCRWLLRLMVCMHFARLPLENELSMVTSASKAVVLESGI